MAKRTNQNSSKEVIQVLARTKSEALLRHTGKTWDQWIRILEKQGAQRWKYGEIVNFLVQQFEVSAWWSQIVTQGFEIKLGRRVEGRNQKGLYSVTLTKSIHVPAKTIWDWMVSDSGQNEWLRPLSNFDFLRGQEFEVEGGFFGKIRSIKSPVRIRMSWQDAEWTKPSIVQIWLLARPKGRATLVISHSDLPSARLRIHYRQYWQDHLLQIKERLEAESSQ